MKPAAVELHATLDLLDESLSKVTLTADTASERAALPKASSLGGCLLMADRGYFDRDYFLELTKAGASFVIRAPKGLNPKVLEAFDAQGRRIPKFGGKPLKTLRFAKRGAVNLCVRWKIQGQPLECRLIVTWNSSTREFQYLATNLPPERYSVYEVAKAYRLRWQVELLFKEWKSYANLHAFDTQNPAIVEGLIWAAISAAALKRFLAHTAQVVAGVETSTRKVAMCAVHFLHEILRALISRSRIAFSTPLHAPSITSPGTQGVHTLNGIDATWAAAIRSGADFATPNYITYEPILRTDRRDRAGAEGPPS